MHALTVALYRRLAYDPDLANLLARHDGQAAVFTSREVPPNAALPYLLVRPPATDVPWDGLRRKGRTVIQDIAAFADAKPGTSTAAIDNLAERVRDILHEGQDQLDVDGWHVAMLSAAGPFDSPQEESGYAGRVVMLTAHLQRG